MDMWRRFVQEIKERVSAEVRLIIKAAMSFGFAIEYYDLGDTIEQKLKLNFPLFRYYREVHMVVHH